MEFKIGTVVEIDFRGQLEGLVVGYDEQTNCYNIAVPFDKSVNVETINFTNYEEWIFIKVHTQFVGLPSIVDRLKRLGICQAIVDYDSEKRIHVVKVSNPDRYNLSDCYFVPMTFFEKFTLGIRCKR